MPALLKNDDHKNTVKWSDSGDSFVIVDMTHFSETVVPLYFGNTNFSSFIRQLNLYGFRKGDSQGKKVDEYKHDFFQKQRPDLLQALKRKKKFEEESKRDSSSSGFEEDGTHFLFGSSMPSSMFSDYQRHKTESLAAFSYEDSIENTMSLLKKYSEISKKKENMISSIGEVKDQFDSLK